MTFLNELESLPSEIHDNIFNYLTFYESMQCATVCSSWRSLILNWPGLWRRLSTDDGHNLVPDLLAYMKYIRGPDVKHLCLKSWNAQTTRVIDFLCELQCRNIEHAEFSVKSLSENSFFKLKDLCGSTLTCVIVDIGPTGAPYELITVDQILLHCPNLKKLCYVTSRWRYARYTPELDGFQHQNLIDLALQVDDSDGGFDLPSYLRSVPKLQRLYLGFDDIDGVAESLPSLLHQCCPDIASLHLKDGKHPGIAQVKNTEWQVQQKPRGLLELAVGDFLGNWRKVDIAKQYIEESRESLQVLELTKNYNFPERVLEFLSTLVFPSLTHLDLAWTFCGVSQALCELLARSVPNLTSLRLSLYAFPEGDTLLQMIASTLNRLERVCFDMFDQKYSSEELVRFFDAMAGGPLRTIVFQSAKSVTPAVLETIATRYLVMDEFAIERSTGASGEEIATFLNRLSLERHMNKLHFRIDDWSHERDVHPDKDTVMRFLAAMDKVARQWTLTMKFPHLWEGFSYNSRHGTMDHSTYRTYMQTL